MEGIIGLLVLLLFGAVAITNLVCFIIVLIGMFTQEDSILHGLLGLLCCNIYVFIWGFVKWQSKYKGLVMALWTICIILAVVLNVALSVLGASAQGGGY